VRAGPCLGWVGQGSNLLVDPLLTRRVACWGNTVMVAVCLLLGANRREIKGTIELSQRDQCRELEVDGSSLAPSNLLSEFRVFANCRHDPRLTSFRKVRSRLCGEASPAPRLGLRDVEVQLPRRLPNSLLTTSSPPALCDVSSRATKWLKSWFQLSGCSAVAVRRPSVRGAR
jgi:hypothetical protein